ncbi:hypothetical protein [Fervidobacterium thailandense]|uniref:Uncharacterized protein n=1 Tax=Fervidobacterium thailandense TaxID=1008305 RepID=A0A1E3G159_9BACT|nr:hypothetical protein [Fervidobacterium thailandense]ODN29989.1 hypothetical protein A4H02_07895 [Fervidobacterium thailandense]
MHASDERAAMLTLCSKLIEKNSPEELSCFITECARKVLLMIQKRLDEDILREIVNSFFLEKLHLVCEKIVNTRPLNPSGYFYKAVENFVYSWLSKRNKQKVVSLDSPIDSLQTSRDDPESVEFIDVISAEDDKLTESLVDVLAEEYFEPFVSFCKRKRTDMFLYICFLISQHYNESDRFRNPSWSQANVYKIIERTRKFLREFQEEFSIEDRVLGKILETFYQNECRRYENR